MQLRKYTMEDVLKDTPLMEQTVVFEGTLEGCQKYARDNGYIWKDSRKYLFGGCWYHPTTRDCLNPS